MTVLLVGHGSRDPRFADTMSAVVAATARALPTRRVSAAFLGLTSPSIPAALDGLDGKVDVVPALLSDGFHTRVDLPAILREAARPGIQLHQRSPIGGVHLMHALRDRLWAAGWRRDDGIVLTAVGSSDPAANAAVQEVGTHLERLTNAPVQTLFASRATPDSAQATLRQLRSRGARGVVVCPYFLSAGVLTTRAVQLLDQHRDQLPMVVAEPLADHPDVVDAIVRRVSPINRLTGDLGHPSGANKHILALG